MIELIKISEVEIVTVRAEKSTFTVSATKGNKTTKFDIKGISIIPQFTEYKPNDIRNSIINKKQTKEGTNRIDEFTKKGIYFVNIKDYSIHEIQYLSKHISDKWLSEIWPLLTSIKANLLSLSLSDIKMKEIILEENSSLFKNENEFNNFCSIYKLSIKNFIEPANFSKLDLKLKEIETRLDLEQFYARRYLFCSMLTEKLMTRIEEYRSNGNQIDVARINLINIWIKKLKLKLEVLKNYNNYYKLYDMSETSNKIEIKDSKNVNIISGNISDSKIIQKSKKSSSIGSLFSKRVKIWIIALMILSIIVTIIINWDNIF